MGLPAFHSPSREGSCATPREASGGVLPAVSCVKPCAAARDFARWATKSRQRLQLVAIGWIM